MIKWIVDLAAILATLIVLFVIAWQLSDFIDLLTGMYKLWRMQVTKH
jgi:hypothetical protein